MLVLEDVHWADDATLDSITVLGRRIGSLPALLVLTFRAGEVPPAHPLHATVGAIRADDSVFLELAPLSEARGRLARRRRRRRGVRGNRRQPVLRRRSCSPPGPPPSCRPRSRTRCSGRASRLDEAARRLVELVSVVPNRVSTSLLDSVMPGWAGAADEPERRRLLEVDSAYVRFRHELARHAIRSSLPVAARRRLHAEILEALLEANADPADIVHHAEAAGARGRRRRLRARRRAARGGARVESRGVLPLPARVGFRRPAAAARAGDRARGAGERRVRRRPARRRVPRDRARDRHLSASSATRRPSAGARESCRGCTGSPARAASRGRRQLEAIAILEPLGESVELARAYSGLSQLAMLAEDARAGARRGGPGARARDPARRREHARARARQHRQRQDPAGSRRDRRTSRGARHRRRRRGAGRGDARARQPRLHAHVLGAAGAGVPVRAAGARLRRGARGPQPRSRTSRTMLAWLRLRAGEWDEAERVTRGEIEQGQHRRPAAREDGPDRAGRFAGAIRMPPSGWPTSRRRPIAPSELQRIGPVLELADRVGLDERRADADRAVREDRRRDPAARRSRRVPSRSEWRRGRPSPGSTSISTSRRRPRARRHAARGTGQERPTPSARSAGRTTGR